MKAYVLRLTAAAEMDLQDIWLYIAQDNIAAADLVASAIEKNFELVCLFPALGMLRHDLKHRPRVVLSPPYLIAYRAKRQLRELQVLRVLHMSRDINAILGW